MSNSTMKMKNETPLLTVPCRSSLKKHAFYGILALVCLLGLGITESARANYIVTLQQVGSNVVANGSGAIDLTGLALAFSGVTSNPLIRPATSLIITGPAGPGVVDQYFSFSISGPNSFGGGGLTFVNSGSGDVVGITVPSALGDLLVPHGYTSDTALSDSSIYNNATFSSLGVTPGTYEWTWGNGADQNFTLQIGPARVPDAGSTLPLLGFASLGLVALRRKLRC